MARSSSETATGTVNIDGNADKLFAAYQKASKGSAALNAALRDSAKAWDTQAEAAKRAEQAAYVAAARLENARDRAAALDQTFGKAGKQAVVAANGITRVGAAAHHGRGPMQALGSAVHNVAAGQASLGQAVNQVLSAFGPWGMVIGAAATALFHFGASQLEAGKKAEEATLKIRDEVKALKDLGKEARLQELNKADKAALETNVFGASTDEAEVAQQKAKAIRRELKRLGEDEDRRKRLSRADQAVQDKADFDRAKRVAELTEQTHATEREIAGLKANAPERKLLEVRLLQEQAKIVEVTGTHEEHQAALHQADLATIRLTVVEEKKRTKEKEKQLKLISDAQFSAGLAGPNFRGQFQNERDKMKFNAALEESRMSGLKRPLADASEAERATAGQLRQIEADREADKDGKLERELERIEQEKQALLSLNETKMQLVTTGAERDALLEEQKQISHDANLQRLAAEQEAEKKRTETIKDFGQKAVGSILSISDARRQAVRLAKLQGATDKEAAKAGKIAALEQSATALREIRNLAAMKAVFEVAEGIAAFARYDFAGGAQHMAAAAAYSAAAVGTGLAARGLENRADAMHPFEAKPGGPLGKDGKPQGNSPRSGTSPIDSQIPGSPTPQPTSSQSQQQGANGPQFHNCNFYGTPKRDFIRQITEGQRDLGYGEPARRSA